MCVRMTLDAHMCSLHCWCAATHTHTHAHVCVYLCTHTRMHAYMCIFVHTYIPTLVRTPAHAHTNACMHAQPQARPPSCGCSAPTPVIATASTSSSRRACPTRAWWTASACPRHRCVLRRRLCWFCVRVCACGRAGLRVCVRPFSFCPSHLQGPATW